MEDFKKNDSQKELEPQVFTDADYSDLEDTEIIDSDDEYATNYIVGRLFDAKEILTDLIDYLENSPYALERGGEEFKKYLERAKKIQEALDNFWDDKNIIEVGNIY